LGFIHESIKLLGTLAVVTTTDTRNGFGGKVDFIAGYTGALLAVDASRDRVAHTVARTVDRRTAKASKNLLTSTAAPVTKLRSLAGGHNE
jgi:hypothetical protein